MELSLSIGAADDALISCYSWSRVVRGNARLGGGRPDRAKSFSIAKLVVRQYV